METVNINCTKEEAKEIWDKWKTDNNALYLIRLRRCKACHSKAYLRIKHLNGDMRDNCAKNCICLCFSCFCKEARSLKIVYAKHQKTITKADINPKYLGGSIFSVSKRRKENK